MQHMKKKQHPTNEDSKKKERHIVTWTQEEDDILREQISIHGTENWAIIASKFKDKTTRQCRRRWYTYLNSDFKKGGWSPEEDMLLCEAQKIFGNRWTEIAKVVSGRTDNAVKNRFSTLCKKRAKHEALANENSSSCTSSNSKGINLQNGFTPDAISVIGSPAKKLRRSHICEITESVDFRETAHKQCQTPIHDQPRSPFTIIAQSAYNHNNLPAQQINDDGTEVTNGVQHNKIEGAFLKKDDPKIIALMQQAELLTSLAQKVNTENSDQSLDNVWKVLQDLLSESQETDNLRCKTPDRQLDDLKDIMEDLIRISNGGSTQPWRQPNLYEDSPGSSEYSTGSTLLLQSVGNQLPEPLHQDDETDLKVHNGGEKSKPEGENVVLSDENIHQDILSSSGDKLDTDDVLSTPLRAEFNSPLQVTPMFRSMAAGIPSPKFSESERNFLMRTLGIESPSQHRSNNSSQPPLCKRALLQSQ